MKLGFLLILLLPLGAQAYVTWHIYQLVPGSVAVKALCAVLATLAFACFFSIFHAYSWTSGACATWCHAVSW